MEAPAGYTGAVLVPPCAPVALAAGIRTAATLAGERHADRHSWSTTADRLAAVIAVARAAARRPPATSSPVR